MNKPERAAFTKVVALLEAESDRRAGAHPARHPYMLELSQAWSGLHALERAINRHHALAAKWKAQRKAKR